MGRRATSHDAQVCRSVCGVTPSSLAFFQADANMPVLYLFDYRLKWLYCPPRPKNDTRKRDRFAIFSGRACSTSTFDDLLPLQHTCIFYKSDDCFYPYTFFQITQHVGPAMSHFLSVILHYLQRGADIWR